MLSLITEFIGCIRTSERDFHNSRATPDASVLCGVDPQLGGRGAASWNCKAEAVEAFSRHSKVPSRASAEGGGNLGQKLIMVRTAYLEEIDESLSFGHIKYICTKHRVQRQQSPLDQLGSGQFLARSSALYWSVRLNFGSF